MFDFRLRVFYVVAQRLNFTKAAEELFITQPAVSKHIHEIESYYKTKLFERNGTKIKLTQAARILLAHTEDLINIYGKMENALADLTTDAKGVLRIGASTTVADYFLPKYLAGFRNRFPEVSLSLAAHNTEYIETFLLEDKIELGIVEGKSKRPHLKYTPIADDELVLCARSDNERLANSIMPEELKSVQFVMREAGSGSLEVILSALKSTGIHHPELNVDIELAHTESIKSYLFSSDSYAFLSRYAITDELQNGKLKVISVKTLNIVRHFFAVTKSGNTQRLPALFIKSLNSDNLRL